MNIKMRMKKAFKEILKSGQHQIWEKSFVVTLSDLSEVERMKTDLYLIEKYYPGSANIHDDELIRQNIAFHCRHSNLQ